MSIRVRAAIHVVVIAVTAIAGCASVPTGAMSREAFLADQRRQGWVHIGEFGKAWPAVAVREERGWDSIRFERSSGQTHVYRGYDGFALKVIFLRARSGDETVVVFRSERRRDN